MQGPSFLPEELAYCNTFETEEALLQALIKNRVHFIDFFELACADETWCEAHLQLIKQMLRWAARAYFLSEFATSDALRITKSIQSHLSILEPLLHFRSALFYTVIFTIEGKDVLANSLIYGAQSQYFADLFKINCFDKFHNDWTMKGVPLAHFRLVDEYLMKGTIPDLWRHERSEVLALMRLARIWEIGDIVKECAFVLKRYIDRDNVWDTLIEAHRKFYEEWKEHCYDFINRQGWGLRFLPGRQGDLRVEILDYNEETLERFAKVQKWVTHLTFGGRLSEDRARFAALIDSCPKLVGIDLSCSLSYTNQFDSIPGHISELNFSACPWLRHQHLREASLQFPNLKILELANDTQLNYQSWGELGRFRSLVTLNLSGCNQIADEDLKLIGQSCPHLFEINLEECRGFTDVGVADLVHHCQVLAGLNLNRCYPLTDKAIGEIGRSASRLVDLSLVRCVEMTDKGLLRLLRFCHTLRRLDVRQCDFSLKVLEQVRKTYPSLQLIF